MYHSYRGHRVRNTYSRPSHNPIRAAKPALSALMRVNVFFIAAIFLATGFYVLQTNSLVGMGYEIDRLTVAKEELQLNQNELVVKTDFLRSVGNIELQARHLNMEESKQISYLNLQDYSFAFKGAE